MHEVGREFAQQILSDPDLASFWDELGVAIEIPEHFRCLYEPGVGLFLVEPVDGFYGIHVAIPPRMRGAPAVEAGRQAIDWVLGRRKKALARIRRNQPETRFYASLCGMRRYSEDATHVYYEAVRCQ